MRGHRAVAALRDALFDRGEVVAVQPIVVGQVGRAERLIALAVHAVATRANPGEFRLARMRQAGVDVQQCLFDCELSRLEKGGPACVNTTTGVPVKSKVASCVGGAMGDLHDLLLTRCSQDAYLTEMGCPAGAGHLPDLESALTVAVAASAQVLNLGVFHAACKGTPGPPTTPTASVVLHTSGVQKTISCGQVLDDAFFGGAPGLTFTTDLNCDSVTTATNGIVVSKSGVTIDFAGSFSLIGPGSSRLRTGVGILLSPGVRNVTIRNGKQIRRFGVGIGDSGDNLGLVITNGATRVVPLSGGLTNTQVKVESPAGAFVVRVAAADSDLLAIDRADELENSAIAAAAGVGAPVIAHLPAQGILVVRFLEGRTLGQEDVRRGDRLAASSVTRGRAWSGIRRLSVLRSQPVGIQIYTAAVA